MIKLLWRLLFGKCIFKFNKACAEDVFELMQLHNGLADSVKYDEEEYILTVPEKYSHTVIKFAEEREIPYSVKHLPSIPVLYERYKKRPGIIIGVFLFMFIVILSEKVIWDFDITGNEFTTDTEIIEALEAVGCSAGDFIDSMDFSLIQNNCLLGADSLAWISVNMDGNLARVEVREKRVIPLESAPDNSRFANIIAAEDGVIELCRVKNGKAVVAPGNVVRKGELLISGVIDIGETGVRYENADGEVMATVYREIESYIPYERTVQTETGAKTEEIQLKFFGKIANISPKGGFDYKLYGKIVENEKLSLPFGITLPVWLTRTVYSEMQEETVTVDEVEAVRLASEDVSAKLRDMAGTLQVLSVNKEVSTEEDGARVTLGVYGVTDISANYGFTVSDGDADKKEETYTDEENDNG